MRGATHQIVPDWQGVSRQAALYVACGLLCCLGLQSIKTTQSACVCVCRSDVKLLLRLLEGRERAHRVLLLCLCSLLAGWWCLCRLLVLWVHVCLCCLQSEGVVAGPAVVRESGWGKRSKSKRATNSAEGGVETVEGKKRTLMTSRHDRQGHRGR